MVFSSGSCFILLTTVCLSYDDDFYGLLFQLLYAVMQDDLSEMALLKF